MKQAPQVTGCLSGRGKAQVSSLCSGRAEKPVTSKNPCSANPKAGLCVGAGAKGNWGHRARLLLKQQETSRGHRQVLQVQKLHG